VLSGKFPRVSSPTNGDEGMKPGHIIEQGRGMQIIIFGDTVLI